MTGGLSKKFHGVGIGPLSKILAVKDFCESTSLHGYSYLTADSVLSKVVWAIIILIATVAGLYCIAINTRDYMKASIVTNIESTSEKLHVSNLKE